MSRRHLWFVAAAAASGLAASGCSSCRGEPTASRHDGLAGLEIAPGEPVAPWGWRSTAAHEVSVPSSCQLLAAPLRHDMGPDELYFQAAHGDLWHLAVATGAPNAPTTIARGVVALQADGGTGQPSRDVPWLSLHHPPILAASEGHWMAILAEEDTFSAERTIWLWKEGKLPEPLGRGDQLGVVDARCDGRWCAVLTTLPGQVAAPGGRLWLGGYQDSTSAYQHRDLPVDNALPGTYPIGITSISQQSARVDVALATDDTIRFYSAGDGQSASLGEVSIGGRELLDVVATSTAQVAIFATGKPDSIGCVPEGSALVVASTNGQERSIGVTSPPMSGYAHPLGQGALVTWLAAVNCKAPQRKVVWAVVLDAAGVPIGEPMAMGDADGYAVATSGDVVHVWLRQRKGVVWLRTQCKTSQGPRSGE